VTSTAAGGTPTEALVVSHTYAPRTPGGPEAPGLLATAVKSGKTESYGYTDGTGASVFSMIGDGQQWVRHTYSGGAATSSTTPASSVTIGATETNPIWCLGRQVPYLTRTITDALTSTGDISGSYAPVTTVKKMLPDLGSDGWDVIDATDQCSSSFPNSCSPGTVHHEFPCPPTFDTPMVERGFSNKRGYWQVYDTTIPADKNPAHVERTATKKGALSLIDSNPLETERYSYVYFNSDPANARGDLQLTSSVKRASLLGPTGSDAETRTLYPTNGAGNVISRRVKATIRHGWTKILDAAGNQQTMERYIGTFYLTKRQCSGEILDDPHQRTLEVHGPCLVDSFTSTGCSIANSTIPITQYFYNADVETDGSVNAASGKLNKTIVYTGTNTPNSCPASQAGATTALTTQYLAYDSYSRPTHIRDPNGVDTLYSYVDGQVTMQTIGSATTSFTYDDRKLKTVTSPGGNVEVYCYRTGVNCDGAWTNRLQWRAVTDTPHASDGTFWTERVEYSYRSDGTLAVESYRDSSASGGAIRRVRKFAFDAHRRQTLQGAGGSTGVADSATYFGANAYDGASNLTGVGLAFNTPPAWCGGVSDVITGAPLSQLCAALQYDAADRLIQLTEYPTSGAAQRTIFSYNGNGNISGVKTGCGSTDTYATCSTPASTYSYDDLGNGLEVTLGGSASGPVRFEYDAGGRIVKKRTAVMASGEYLGSTYDAAGRLLELNDVTASGSVLLYRHAWDDAGVTAPTGCGVDLSASASRAFGRIRYRQDSFGYTWFRYDEAGRVLDEIRARDGTCTTDPHNNPGTHYSYNANGDLASIVYPYGRTVQYIYGSGALAARVASVKVTFGDGTSWAAPTTTISNAQWEPYGGLRSYQIAAGTGELVEYLLGDNSANPGCPSGRPTGNDSTGRLRGLWVSAVGGSSPGDIFKLTYTWQADQITQTDTCLLGTSTPRTETFDYDRTLRLTNASRPTGNFAASGGAFSARTYGYDGRGNRGSSLFDAFTIAPSFHASRVDHLLSFANPAGGSLYGYTFTYDADGRVNQKSGPVDSTGLPASVTSYASGPSGSGATDTVFRSVTVQGASYNYFYDGLNRRRLKSYPTGISDEYFYDLGHQLLIDQGNSSLTTPVSNYPLDEYIWLGGRPVAMIHSNLGTSWTHQADSVGSCPRNGNAAVCGIHFPLTDVIGKPMLMLNAAGRVVGTGEYDPFGHVNRVFIDAETPHPYDSATTGTFADFTQFVATGVSLDMRLLLDMVDLNVTTSADSQCAGGAPVDILEVRDGAVGTLLASVSGIHRGLLTTDWLLPSAGRLALSIAGSGRCTVAGFPNCTTTCDTVTQKTEKGVVAASYEYRRYEAGQQPFWTPLRFPGQYYDAESDLFENWNRYYEPSIGRYLQPEPLLSTTSMPTKMAGEGRSAPAYAYSENNPLSKQDPDGRLTRQYRRDGKGNETVRRLEERLRQELIDQCAKEADKNLNGCQSSSADKCPPLPQNPSQPDARRRDEEMLRRMLECEKGAQCEYEACLAGATSASGTTDWAQAWTACMARP